jgi:hypothetical protein
MRKSLETAYTHQVFDYEDYAFDVTVAYFCPCVLSGNAPGASAVHCVLNRQLAGAHQPWYDWG